MPGIDQLVHFTRSAPFDIKSGQLVFYDVVERSTLSRSSVLSCVADAGGEAKLPDSVTVSDFRKWLAAVTDSHDSFRRRPFSHMFDVIKVADAVDDRHLDEWVHIAAESLVHTALSTSYEESKQDVSEGMPLLPEHLQRRVFADAAFDLSSLDSWLPFFPTALHASVLAAKITPDHVLRLRLADASLPALKALACLPASPPSLLSFQGDSDSSTEEVNVQQSEDRPGRTSDRYRYLAQALRHHTGLTSLLLQSSPIIATPRQLLPAVATLTCLQVLDLEGFCAVRVQSALSIQQTLHDLPQLRHLKLLLTEEAADTGKKRPRDEDDTDEATDAAPLCLADMLSPATALTSLSLRTAGPAGCKSSQSRGCCFAVLNPLMMPQLAQLTAIFHDSVHLAASFFSHLGAPLTSLQLADGLQQPYRTQAAAAPAVQQLIHSLAHFTHLRCLNATFPTDVSAPDISGIFDSVTGSLPSLLPIFRQLHELMLSAEPTVVYRLVPHLAAAATSLTRLHLGFLSPHRYPWGFARNVTIDFAEVFRSLCQLKLQHLELDWERDSPPWGRSGMHIAALQPLSALTALRIKGWACLSTLGSPADGEALAGMTHLRRLSLEQATDFSLRSECMVAMRALSALTSLTVKTSEEDEFLVSDLASQLPPQSLPQLQQLEVALWHPFDYAEALVRYAAALPALTRLRACLIPTERIEQLRYGDCFEREYFQTFLGRVDVAEARLNSAAARDGVELVIDRDAVDNPEEYD